MPRSAILRLPDDHVVNQVYLEELGGFPESRCQASVCITRARIAGGVVVRDNEGIGGGDDGRPKYLPWVGRCFVDGSGGDEVPTERAEFGVEADCNEDLLFRFVVGSVSNRVIPEVADSLRVVQRHLRCCKFLERGFSDPRYFVAER